STSGPISLHDALPICGAHMKAYGHLLADDRVYAERAGRFAASVRDLAEFLASEPLRGPLSPVPLTCTYHDPCHVVHGQKIKSERSEEHTSELQSPDHL